MAYSAPPAAPAGGYPIQVSLTDQRELSRWWGIPFFGVLVRGVLAIPHFAVLAILGIVLYLWIFLGWIAILLTGRVPGIAVKLLTEYIQRGARAGGYVLFLLPGGYPPLEPGATSPVDVQINLASLEINRLWGIPLFGFLVRFLVVIPAHRPGHPRHRRLSQPDRPLDPDPAHRQVPRMGDLALQHDVPVHLACLRVPPLPPGPLPADRVLAPKPGSELHMRHRHFGGAAFLFVDEYVCSADLAADPDEMERTRRCFVFHSVGPSRNPGAQPLQSRGTEDTVCDAILSSRYKRRIRCQPFGSGRRRRIVTLQIGAHGAWSEAGGQPTV